MIGILREMNFIYVKVLYLSTGFDLLIASVLSFQIISLLFFDPSAARYLTLICSQELSPSVR